LRQQAANNEQIDALNDAAEQIKEAQEMQDDIDIANWVLFAVTTKRLLYQLVLSTLVPRVNVFE
jgi:hypothetical protein